MHVHDVQSFAFRAKLPFALLLTIILSVACSAPAPDQPAAEEPAAADSAPAGPRVFFVQPQDGATVMSPVTLQFGLEDYTLAPVPQGEVTDPRPGAGHHHVGLNTQCLPPGTEIPMASPWVHFGDGGSMIDMMLNPGVHTLTLQLGDDLHRTIEEGLCTTISITVVE